MKPIKKWLNLLTNSGVQLTDDDLFDEKTLAAVKEFQIRNRATNAHGAIDEVTLYNILTRVGSGQIKEALTENPAFRVLVSNIALPYDDEVHKGLTSILAMAAGFIIEDAEKISTANVYVDINRNTQPMPTGVWDVTSGANRQRLKDWHFVTPERLRELDNLWREDGNLSRLGDYLHAFQDSFSHKGLGPSFGQAGTRVDENGNVRRDAVNPFKTERWHEVDDPSKRPQLAFDMAKQTYDILIEAVKICKQKNTIGSTFFLSPWSTIKDTVWRFCSEKDRNIRDKILTDLYTSLRVTQENFKKTQENLRRRH